MFTNRNLIGIRKKSDQETKRKLIGKIDPETGEIIPTRNHVSDIPDGSGDLPASVAELKSFAIRMKKSFPNRAKNSDAE